MSIIVILQFYRLKVGPWCAQITILYIRVIKILTLSLPRFEYWLDEAIVSHKDEEQSIYFPPNRHENKTPHALLTWLSQSANIYIYIYMLISYHMLCSALWLSGYGSALWNHRKTTCRNPNGPKLSPSSSRWLKLRPYIYIYIYTILF